MFLAILHCTNSGGVVSCYNGCRFGAVFHQFCNARITAGKIKISVNPIWIAFSYCNSGIFHSCAKATITIHSRGYVQIAIENTDSVMTLLQKIFCHFITAIEVIGTDIIKSSVRAKRNFSINQNEGNSFTECADFLI